MFPRFVVAGFLLAHALIHTGFLGRPPATPGGPAWPFELGRSWLLSPLGVDPGVVRVLGLALVAVLVAGYATAALAVLGPLELLFVPAIVIGSMASLGLLIVFFHPWLVLGIAIDLGLLWATLVLSWLPESLGT
jgi:hypothetical protein